MRTFTTQHYDKLGYPHLAIISLQRGEFRAIGYDFETQAFKTLLQAKEFMKSKGYKIIGV